MNHDEIDRILAGEPPLEPSSGFATEVMAAVRREAEGPQPLPFPWRRVAPGLAVCAILAVLAFVMLPWTTAAVDAESSAFVTYLEHLLLAQSTAWVSGSLLASYLLVRFSLRFAGAES